jgi:Flp pilus assembly protein TadB
MDLTLSYTHITLLVIVAVLLLFLCVIILVHEKQERSRTNKEPDAISVFVEKRKALLKSTGSKISIELYLGLVIACPIIAGIAVYIGTANVIISLFAAVVAGFIPRMLVELAVKRYKKNFEERYSRSLEQLPWKFFLRSMVYTSLSQRVQSS